MDFLFSSFWWALIPAILIPIIIHLFQFRRYKKVLFTNVDLLREVKEERASRTRIKYWLVMLSRIFALSLLVLAFMQPFIPQDEDKKVVKGQKNVSIYLDNSFSMKSLDKEVSLFEKARAKAREIVEAYGPDDRFQLITNDFQGKHQRLLNKEEFYNYLDEVEITPNVQQLSSVNERQKQVLENSEGAEKNIFVLSDFQKNLADMETDTFYNYYIVPLQSANQQNVFIDSAWFESPVQMLNTTSKLLVRTQNKGNADVESSRLTLKINDQVKALKEVNLSAGATQIDTINFSVNEGGWNRAELHITDYPIDFDDTYFFSFNIDAQIKALSINQSSNSKFLNALFKDNDLIQLDNQSAGQINYASFGQYRLIILNNLRDISSGLAAELKRYLDDGGNVVVFPTMDAKTEAYNAFLRSVKANNYQEKNNTKRPAQKINVRQEVFKDVFSRLPKNLDLPVANKSFELSRFSSSNEQQLISFVDGGTMVGRYRVGEGKLYLSAVPLDNTSSNLPSHAVFVPMLYKMALVGGDVRSLAYTIGSNNLIETKVNEPLTAESILKLKSDEGELIPGQKVKGNKLTLSLNNLVPNAGLYALAQDNGDPLAYYGFNFNRKESILDYLSLGEIKEKFSGKTTRLLDKVDTDFSQLVGQIDRGIQLWKWCLIGALIFLLIEILLLRFWKD